MTRVTQGARQRHFILWLGFRVDVVNLKHSWCLYSRRHISPKPIIYVDIWIYDCWSTVNQITVHEPMVSLASPRFRALPPTTNITWKANTIALIKTQTNNILMNLATHLVRTQFVLSVYKRRHRFAVSQSIHLLSLYILP